MHRWLGLFAGFGLLGCINDDLRLYEVALTGEITSVAAGQGGVVHVEVHHASAGTGQLERPLGLIDRFELADGERSVDTELLVPIDEGQGLVVYAWLDLDGDGVLCSLAGNRDEPAGAIELGEFPAHAIDFELELDTACVGPELAWP